MIPQPNWPKRPMSPRLLGPLWQRVVDGATHVSPSGYTAYQLARQAVAARVSVAIEYRIDGTIRYWTIKRAVPTP